jgi:cAMP phosphodiesterase
MLLSCKYCCNILQKKAIFGFPNYVIKQNSIQKNNPRTITAGGCTNNHLKKLIMNSLIWLKNRKLPRHAV